uniref:Uncharacterized protein n=1 Tax=Meloidogyne enterolobii TaxID=390850 RepID=A0A6V7WAP6_MELEN|nr:unnamed protein product [Meloidogyne enterolobii]
MTEEELSTNSDWSFVEKEKNDFENLQKNFVEEKEKTVKLENELKEMNKKIEKINCDNENKIEGMKQNFQKLIEENVRKDDKINSLEEEIQKTNDLCNKKIEDLTIKFNSMYCKCVNFVEIKNKWSEIYDECCSNKCINTNNPIGNCIKGNGFVNIINDENIKYIVGRSKFY